MPNKNSELFDYQKGFTCPFDLKTGLSSQAVPTKRYLSQMKGMFVDVSAYQEALAKEDRMVYEFYEMGFPETGAAIAMGTSVLYPGTIGNEYYFTKGHFHCILETAETYYCLSGRGYLLLENPEGDWVIQKLKPGIAAYVPPRYAHRTINIGEEPLVSFFAFRGDAGHDYGTIEEKGYRKIVVKHDGCPVVLDNPKWK